MVETEKGNKEKDRDVGGDEDDNNAEKEGNIMIWSEEESTEEEDAFMAFDDETIRNQILELAENYVPEATVKLITEALKSLVDKQRLDAAEAEIARLTKLLHDAGLDPNAADGINESARPEGAKLQQLHAGCDIKHRERVPENSTWPKTQGPEPGQINPETWADRSSRRHQPPPYPPANLGPPRDPSPAPHIMPVSPVSVLFADVVGFFRLSAALPALRVADFLRRIFARLDALARRHGVRPVDVVGDAYLAATNLRADQPADHAARLARSALAAAAAARRVPVDPAARGAVAGRDALRASGAGGAALALESGGGRKWTLIGDTVNRASRMESSGGPGRPGQGAVQRAHGGGRRGAGAGAGGAGARGGGGEGRGPGGNLLGRRRRRLGRGRSRLGR